MTKELTIELLEKEDRKIIINLQREVSKLKEQLEITKKTAVEQSSLNIKKHREIIEKDKEIAINEIDYYSKLGWSMNTDELSSLLKSNSMTWELRGIFKRTLRPLHLTDGN